MTSPVPSPSQRAFLEQATAQYQGHLHRAMPYLAARGIGPETAERFRLGVVDEGCSHEHRPYVGRLCIPYLTRSGVVAVRFRTLGGDGPKYLSVSGDIPRLFNVRALFRPGDTLIITEGEFDAITVDTHLDMPAVGVPGVSLWSPIFDRLVADYPNRVVVGDGDEAGRNFANDLAKHLDGRPVHLPDGEDVNSFYVKYGPLELMEVLDA